MPTIHVVHYCGGRYEDAWDTVIKAWSDPDKAAEHVRELEIADDAKRALAKGLRETLNAAEAANPRPQWPTDQLLKEAKWPSGLGKMDITDAMRAERDRVRIHNAEVTDRHSDNQAKWYSETLEPAKIKFLMSHGMTEEAARAFNDWYSGPSEDNRYYIEETELD